MAVPAPVLASLPAVEITKAPVQTSLLKAVDSVSPVNFTVSGPADLCSVVVRTLKIIAHCRTVHAAHLCNILRTSPLTPRCRPCHLQVSVKYTNSKQDPFVSVNEIVGLEDICTSSQNVSAVKDTAVMTIDYMCTFPSVSVAAAAGELIVKSLTMAEGKLNCVLTKHPTVLPAAACTARSQPGLHVCCSCCWFHQLTSALHPPTRQHAHTDCYAQDSENITLVREDMVAASPVTPQQQCLAKLSDPVKYDVSGGV